MKLHQPWPAVLASICVWVAAPAAAATLTFDGLPVGTTLASDYPGVLFSPNAFSGPGTSSSGADWATNTDMTIVDSAGGDVGGLGTPALVGGHLLRSFAGWASEDGDPSFLITFSAPIASITITFAGVTWPADVRLQAYNGATYLGVIVGTSADAQFTLTFSAASITSVAVAPGSFDDWVGVDNINYTPAVPEPAAWTLLAAGLGALALRRRG